MSKSAESREFEAVGLFELAAPTRSEELFAPILGSLVGAASADALGWVTEFMRSPASLKNQLGVDQLTDYVSWNKKVGGRFNTYIDFIGRGEYSDDTQLTLAVARSLNEDGGVDHEYFAKRELARWLDYARGAGRTVTAAAKAAGRKRSPWYANVFRAGGFSYWDSGANGAAMRIAPIALAHLDDDEPPLDQVFANSIITHGHPRAVVGALGYATALHEIGRRRTKNGGISQFLGAIDTTVKDWQPTDTAVAGSRQWLELAEKTQPQWLQRYGETVLEFSRMLRSIDRHEGTRETLTRFGCFDRATRGSGTGTVAAAICLFAAHGANIERAVVEAVNAIPADTDTIGAFVGSMSGLYAGYEAIPERWTTELQDHPYLVNLAEALARIASRETDSQGSLRPNPSRHDQSLPDVMTLLKRKQVHEDQRIRHDVLGSGTIQAIHAQEIRRRRGGEMLYARARMDIGQTCQFRAHIPASS